MEPGSTEYASRMARHTLENRSSKSKQQTQVTIGDNKVFWGCGTDPVAVLDHLGDSCKTSGQCVDSDPYEMSIDYLEPDGDISVEKTLSIADRGDYPPGMRNVLVKAIQEAAGAKEVIEWHRGIHWRASKRRRMLMEERETAGVARPGAREHGIVMSRS